jgi:hypothetical protein
MSLPQVRNMLPSLRPFTPTPTKSPAQKPAPTLDDLAQMSAKELATFIIRAGKLARGELAQDTLPPPGTPARQICEAARKARGEV